MKFINVSDLVRLFKQKKVKHAVADESLVSVCNTSTVPMQVGHMNVPPDHTLTLYNSLPSIGGVLGGMFGNSSLTTNSMIGGVANHNSLTNVCNGNVHNGSAGAVSMSSSIVSSAQSLPWIDHPPHIFSETSGRVLERAYIWVNDKMHGVGYNIQFTKFIINGEPAEGKFRMGKLILFEPYPHAHLSDLMSGFVIRCDDGEFPLGASLHDKYKRMVCTLNTNTALQEQQHVDSGDIMISPADGTFKLWET